MDDNIDQVKCFNCGCNDYKDDAVKINGEWYCLPCAYEETDDDGPHISYNGD